MHTHTHTCNLTWWKGERSNSVHCWGSWTNWPDCLFLSCMCYHPALSKQTARKEGRNKLYIGQVHRAALVIYPTETNTPSKIIHGVNLLPYTHTRYKQQKTQHIIISMYLPTLEHPVSGQDDTSIAYLLYAVQMALLLHNNYVETDFGGRGKWICCGRTKRMQWG